MAPPSLLNEQENHLLDALAMIQVTDPKAAFNLLFQLPFKNRAWMCARAICGYEALPLDRFARTVAHKKLEAASYKLYLLEQM